MSHETHSNAAAAMESLLDCAAGRWPVILTCGGYPLDCSGHFQAGDRDRAREWIVGHVAAHGGSFHIGMTLQPDPEGMFTMEKQPAAGPQRFRKRPIEVQAVQWDGTNTPQVKAFVGPRQQRDREALIGAPISECGFLVAGESAGVLGADAVVFDRFHDWVPLSVGDWIVRGVQGEYYPCQAAVFDQTYTRIDGR